MSATFSRSYPRMVSLVAGASAFTAMDHPAPAPSYPLVQLRWRPYLRSFVILSSGEQLPVAFVFSPWPANSNHPRNPLQPPRGARP